MSTLLLRVERSFSATHQIRIMGELEPVHGHDFRCVAEIESEDDRDAARVLPAVELALAGLSHTHLEAVERSQCGHASAEHIARHLFQDIGGRLGPGLRIARVTVHESPGCSATYRT